MAAARTSIERILCPIDFSDTSHHALAHAAAIARWYEARLSLLYVFVSLPTVDVPPVMLDEDDRERLIAQMREFACIVPRDVSVEYQVQEAGLVHDAIVRHASAAHADLLVLGTHGRSGFQHLFLGSVTEKIMRFDRGLFNESLELVCVLGANHERGYVGGRIELVLEVARNGDIHDHRGGALIPGTFHGRASGSRCP